MKNITRPSLVLFQSSIYFLNAPFFIDYYIPKAFFHFFNLIDREFLFLTLLDSFEGEILDNSSDGSELIPKYNDSIVDSDVFEVMVKAYKNIDGHLNDVDEFILFLDVFMVNEQVVLIRCLQVLHTDLQILFRGHLECDSKL